MARGGGLRRGRRVTPRRCRSKPCSCRLRHGTTRRFGEGPRRIDTSGVQSSRRFAFSVAATRRSTSLFGGRMRSAAAVTSLSRPMQLEDLAHRLGDRVSAPVPRLTTSPSIPSDLAAAHDTAHGVLDVEKVTRRLGRSELDRVSRERLADDRRDHRPRRLPRPEGVERPCDDDRGAERQPVVSARADPRRPSWPRTATAAGGDASRRSGRVVGVPYTSLDDVWTTSRHARCGAQPRGRSTLPRRSPRRTRADGVYEYGIGISAPRWRTHSLTLARAEHCFGIREVAAEDLHLCEDVVGIGPRATRSRCASCNERTRGRLRQLARPLRRCDCR